MQIQELNFIEYLSREEHNLLSSFVNFREEFDLFYNLDKIYQEPLRMLVVSEDNLVVPQLYLFVHFHLYFSVSCMLRAHLSECLSSIRKAIDASLSAYKIILEPQCATQYLNRDKLFQYIKSHLQGERNKNSSKYPLANILIKIHDDCSEYGSHADINSFFHRLEIKNVPGTNKEQLLVHYFQFPRQTEEYKFYFVVTLEAFFLMFMIFKLFFNANHEIIDPKWEQVIKTIGPRLEELRSMYDAKRKK
jgi:hypothetical protein